MLDPLLTVCTAPLVTSSGEGESDVCTADESDVCTADESDDSTAARLVAAVLSGDSMRGGRCKGSCPQIIQLSTPSPNLPQLEFYRTHTLCALSTACQYSENTTNL